jgi:hypothetical protein
MNLHPSNQITCAIHQTWCLAQLHSLLLCWHRKFVVDIFDASRFSPETLWRQAPVSIHLAKKQKSPETTRDAARLLPDESSTAGSQHAVNGETLLRLLAIQLVGLILFAWALVDDLIFYLARSSFKTHKV